MLFFARKASCSAFGLADSQRPPLFVSGYGWHISDLKIYDRPKMITQFKGMCRLKNSCFGCPDWNYQMADCNGRTITRPPQSWCYVEEVRLT